ncbi:MAG TPA: hypothetical protein VLG50_05965 [Candidatus Saccharimonadales bacterium]|nr:hypothetical protein [Candidatus Saccharimonadales bacterium]
MNFNQLPQEVRSAILSYHPTYPRIHKGSYLAYDYLKYHCTLPITVNEFNTYIKEERPKQFIIFNDTRFNTFYVNKYVLRKGDYYNNQRITINIDNLDVDEYHFDIKFHDYKMKNVSIKSNHHYYDVATTFNILKRRIQCIKASVSYALDWVHDEYDYYSTPVIVNDMYSLLFFIKRLLYITINDDVVRNVIYDPILIPFHVVPFTALVFNHEGKPYDEYQLEKFVHKFNL